MKKRNLAKNSNAVTSVILALLLLGLLAITLTTIHTVYVPRWVEQQEGFHMHEVAAQFADLKHAIDIQTVSQDKTPISIPITLGTEQQSFLTTSRAYGSLHINSNSYIISITNATEQLSFSLGSLLYTSRNNYYVDQTYVIEAGAVIINQTEGYIMSTDPPIVLNNQGFDGIYTFFNISERGGKSDIGGFGTYIVQTNYSKSQSFNLTKITGIDIDCSHPNSWHILFNETLQDMGLVYGSDFTITQSGTLIEISIALSADLSIEFNIIEIFAQISPGRLG